MQVFTVSLVPGYSIALRVAHSQPSALPNSLLPACMVLNVYHSCSSQVIQCLGSVSSYKLLFFHIFETTRLPCDFDVFKKSYDFVD